MDIETIKILIGDIGFPIIACFFMYKMNKDQREEHERESEGLRKIIDNNTQVLIQLKAEMEARWSINKKED